jgi:hypothetical protein
MEDGAEVEDRLGSVGLGVNFFCWMNPTSILPFTILPKMGGNFFDFWGRFLLRFKVGLEKVGLGVILQSFLVILPPILP